MIKLKKQLSSDEVEEIYKDVFKNVDGQITVPTKFDRQDFSQVAQIIQLMATALRLQPDGRLIIGIDSIPESQEVSEIMNDPTIFALILFYWNKEIVNSKNEPLKKNFWHERDIKIEAMQNLKYGKGNKSFTACFDHLPVSIGSIKSWYSGNDFISNERDLDAFIDKTLTKVGSFSPFNMKRSTNEIVDDLRVILFELLKNTDEHGRTDEFGNVLNPSIRGIHSVLHRKSKKDFLLGNAENKGLKNYFNNVETKENEYGQIIFLEISVFDSGVGLSTKYSKKPIDTISVLDEVEYVKECLTKNKTSATGELKLKKGKGLDKVLRTLNNKGFVKIRSGRTCLFRDLATIPYENVENAKDIKVFDWYTNSELNFTELSPVSGTIFSMFYPIDASYELEADSESSQISLF